MFVRRSRDVPGVRGTHALPPPYAGARNKGFEGDYLLTWYSIVSKVFYHIYQTRLWCPGTAYKQG